MEGGMADLIDRIAYGVERPYAFGEWTGAQVATEFDLQGVVP